MELILRQVSHVKERQIPAVEDGVIDKIRYEGESGWVIKTQSKSGYWSYLHTFQDGDENLSKQIKVGDFILRKYAGGIYIEKNGVAIQVKDKITLGQLIAPIGDSGIGTGAHLHLNFNRGDNNPLSQFAEIPTNYGVTIQKPADGEEVSTDDLKKDYPVNFTVDMARGKNLDVVNVYLDGNLQTYGDNNTASFCYGGIPGETRINMNASNSVCGIDPEKGTYKRMFGLPCDFSNLREGDHEIKIVTINANSHSSEKKFKFKVKKELEGIGSIKGVECGMGSFIVFTGLNKSIPTEYKITIMELKGELDLDKNGNINWDDSDSHHSFVGKGTLKVTNAGINESNKDEHILVKLLNNEAIVKITITLREPSYVETYVTDFQELFNLGYSNSCEAYVEISLLYVDYKQGIRYHYETSMAALGLTNNKDDTIGLSDLGSGGLCFFSEPAKFSKTSLSFGINVIGKNRDDVYENNSGLINLSKVKK